LVKIKISHHKRSRVAALDIRKAFDSIDHSVIEKCCRASGLNEDSLSLLNELYRDCFTTLTVNGETSSIQLKKGVKQGDPMSPVLFNIVADQLLHLLEHSGLGVKIGQGLLPGIAYADDLILFARSDQELQSMISLCQHFYENVGLSINESKSVVMGTSSPIIINGQHAPTTDCLHYLGVDIDRSGKRRFERRDITEMIEKLAKARINSSQRLYFVRFHLIPSILHCLVNQRSTRTILKSMDNLILVNLRKFLHQPKSTPSSFYHLSNSNGGLGIIQLSFDVPKMIWDRGARIRNSQCWIMQEIWKTKWFKTEMDRVHRLLPDGDNQKRLLQDISHIPANRGHQNFLVGGNIIGRCFNGFSGLAPNQLNKLIRMRNGSVAYQHNNPGADKRFNSICRFGCRQPESLSHILGGCRELNERGWYNRRHDDAQAVIVAMLRDGGLEVHTGLVFNINGRLRKPDIIAYNKEKNKCYCLDLRFRFEGDQSSLQAAYEEKKEKYVEIEPQIKAFISNQPPIFRRCRSVNFYGLIIGSRGALHNVALNLLSEFGVSKSRIETLCTGITLSSWKLVQQFVRLESSNGPHSHQQ